MRHQAGNEMDVAGETVELGDYDGTAQRACLRQSRSQLRPPVERIASLTGFNLDEFRRDFETGVRCEPGQRFALRIDTQARTPLLACANTDVGDDRLHERPRKSV